MTEFLGHFHPLLVHLPIGILLTAILLQWLSQKGKSVFIKGKTESADLIIEADFVW